MKSFVIDKRIKKKTERIEKRKSIEEKYNKLVDFCIVRYKLIKG